MSNFTSYLTNNNLTEIPSIINGYATIMGYSTEIQAGEYLITTEDSLQDLFIKITSGNFHYRKIQLLEGMSFLVLFELLKLSNGLVNDLGKLPEQEILKKVESDYLSAEGIFSPDTYFYRKGDTASSILIRAYNQQLTYSLELWNKRFSNLPFLNLHEALVLASVIEKEGLEKKRIAGVFIKRLMIGMKLQSDPTVIYAMGKDFKGNITRKDLKRDHPHNTYLYKGLPPTPISMVTISSIEAVLQPIMGSDLYFVSRGDGHHQFSATLDAHNAAVRKYQLKK